MTNRVLRFVQRPAGVYHSSVFHQFSGRMGPSALAVDPDGLIYVARYDFAGGCLRSTLLLLCSSVGVGLHTGAVAGLLLPPRTLLPPPLLARLHLLLFPTHTPNLSHIPHPPPPQPTRTHITNPPLCSGVCHWRRHSSGP